MTFAVERLVPDWTAYESPDIFGLGETARYFSEVNFATNPLDMSCKDDIRPISDIPLNTPMSREAWEWYWYTDEELLHSQFENQMQISMTKRYLNFLASLRCAEILTHVVQSTNYPLSIPISPQDFQEPVKESAECLVQIEHCLKAIAKTERPVHETAVAVANYFRLDQANRLRLTPERYENLALTRLAEFRKSSTAGFDYCRLYDELKTSIEEIAKDDVPLRMGILSGVMRAAGRILLPLPHARTAGDYEQLSSMISDPNGEYNIEVRFHENMEYVVDLLPPLARTFQESNEFRFRNENRDELLGSALSRILIQHRGEFDNSDVDYGNNLYANSFRALGLNPSSIDEGMLKTALGLSFSDYENRKAEVGEPLAWVQLAGLIAILIIFGELLPPAANELLYKVTPRDRFIHSIPSGFWLLAGKGPKYSLASNLMRMGALSSLRVGSTTLFHPYTPSLAL
jgi:hypothetical protein